jgi:hypothetical protein
MLRVRHQYNIAQTKTQAAAGHKPEWGCRRGDRQGNYWTLYLTCAILACAINLLAVDEEVES